MKTTEQKRAELLALLKGEKTVIELTMESVDTLSIRGTVESPEYWVGNRKVEETEFAKYYGLLQKGPEPVAIDWSYEDKYDYTIYVPPSNSTYWRSRRHQ